MKDKEYGVPSQKKFPLDSKEHVLSAIRFFNYVDPAYEKELASAIISKIKEYDISNLTPSAANRFYKYYKPDYVEHHGIIGQKWGDRNGPPYPLSGSEHSAVVKSANKKSAGSGRKLTWRQRRKAKKNLKKARAAAAQKRLDDKEKERLVREGSASEVYARRNDLTIEQKRRAQERLNLDDQLATLSAKELARRKSKVDKMIETLDRAAKITVGVYNTANNINNIRKLFSGEDISSSKNSNNSNNNDKKKKDKKSNTSKDAKDFVENVITIENVITDKSFLLDDSKSKPSKNSEDFVENVITDPAFLLEDKHSK